jgi:protein TonB
VQRVNPAYPAAARQMRMAGTVQMRFTVGADGVPKDIQTVSGNGLLVGAARDAIARWRYRPAQRGGVAVEEQVTVTVDFRLPQ